MALLLALCGSCGEPAAVEDNTPGASLRAQRATRAPAAPPTATGAVSARAVDATPTAERPTEVLATPAVSSAPSPVTPPEARAPTATATPPDAKALPTATAGHTTSAAYPRRLPELPYQPHVEPGEEHPPYNSTPATSGQHHPFWAKWGVHDVVLPDEVLVHNLEHAGVGIHYDCPEGCPELLAELTAIASRYTKVIMTPYPGLHARIALTAWTYLDLFDEFDEARIVGFIEAHVNSNEAPEPLAP